MGVKLHVRRTEREHSNPKISNQIKSTRKDKSGIHGRGYESDGEIKKSTK
jgi:hypothetical protein